MSARGRRGCKAPRAGATSSLPSGSFSSAVPAADYRYDDNGNRVYQDVEAVPVDLAWDFENRMVGVEDFAGGSESYTYDGNGQRQSRTVGEGTVQFMWDGANVLQEVDATGSLLAHYTDYPGSWGGMVSQRREGSSSYYLHDQSGNVRLLTDSSGAITDRYLHTAYGKEISTTGSTTNPYRFGGQVGYYRDSANRYHVRARNYDAEVGGWTSSDPLERDSGDDNAYRYGEGNPIWGIDPTGTYVVLIRGGVGHDPTGGEAMPELHWYIQKHFKETVYAPDYDWSINHTRHNYPIAYPPGPEMAASILHGLYQWLKSPKSKGSSDPHGIYIYGTSYGGFITGYISNPPAGSDGHEVRRLKRKIRHDFHVSFKRYVVSVVDVQDYPGLFSRVDANLYTDAGDPSLAIVHPLEWSEDFEEKFMNWMDPEHYNLRQLTARPDRWGIFKRQLVHQPYWYPGRTRFGQDDIAMQLPGRALSAAGNLNWIPKPYAHSRVYTHFSFDAHQGLSEAPPLALQRRGYENPYEVNMIRVITQELLRGHP